MPIACLTLELRIEAAKSLKDKRQVVRSVKDRLRAHFNVSVAELEAGEAWQRATIFAYFKLIDKADRTPVAANFRSLP